MKFRPRPGKEFRKSFSRLPGITIKSIVKNSVSRKPWMNNNNNKMETKKGLKIQISRSRKKLLPPLRTPPNKIMVVPHRVMVMMMTMKMTTVNLN